jgi:hypothetical protein
MMFNNLEDLPTTDMPLGYPHVDSDQTRETLKDGSPTKGTFTSNFGHVRQWAHCNNHKEMHDHIDIVGQVCKRGGEVIPPMLPPLFPVLLPRHHDRAPELDHVEKKIRIIVDLTNAILEGDTANANAQMPKPGVDSQRNPTVYYGKALMRHWIYIWYICQRHLHCNILLYKDNINADFRRIMYHPDTAPAFATVLQHMLCIPVGLIFGAGFSAYFFCNASKIQALAATASPLFIPELTLTPDSATALTDVHALAATTRRQDASPPDDIDLALRSTLTARIRKHVDTSGNRPYAPSTASSFCSRLPPHHLR